MSNICPFYSKQYRQNVKWLAYEVQKFPIDLFHVLTKCDRLFTERSNLTNPHTTPNRQICKGELWNQYTDPIEGENLVKFIHETKDKYEDKISPKNDIKCTIYTHHRSDRAIQSMQFMHIDSLGNTHPLKVDRNLQWMSHHPTNPTYNPVLSGTMTHLSARCQ